MQTKHLLGYQKTRKFDHPREFLKDFKGIVVTDGYQVYHSIDKAFGHGSKREIMSHEAEDRISKMFAIVLTKNNTFVYSLITETFQWTTMLHYTQDIFILIFS